MNSCWGGSYSLSSFFLKEIWWIAGQPFYELAWKISWGRPREGINLSRKEPGASRYHFAGSGIGKDAHYLRRIGHQITSLHCSPALCKIMQVRCKRVNRALSCEKGTDYWCVNNTIIFEITPNLISRVLIVNLNSIVSNFDSSEMLRSSP